MNILLIYRINITDKTHSGALIKMESQKSAFESLGHKVDLINHDEHAIYLNNQQIKQLDIKNKWKRYFLNHRGFFKTLIKKVDFEKYDLIYMRYPFSNPSLLSFCKAVKQSSKDNKLVIEMPTFPYNDEFQGIMSIYLPIDNYYREKLRAYVDNIIHFGREKKLFGIPVINTTNGIGLGEYKLKKDSSTINQKINLIAVGKWSYWHGLDRLIKGMNHYYQSGKGIKDIELNIIGEGNEIGNLKDLVRRFPKLEGKVNFCGIHRDESLDRYFDEADIGIGTLGMHRKHLNYNAALKHREYCIRGLKFILATADEAFPDSLEFVSYMPDNDNDIDITKLIELSNRKITKSEIRMYGEENLSWKGILSSIMKELNRN